VGFIDSPQIISQTQTLSTSQISMVNIPSIPQPLWHHLRASKILDQLASNPDFGLTSDEVAKRHSEFGFNELVSNKGKPSWLKFILQFNQPLLLPLKSSGCYR